MPSMLPVPHLPQ